MKITKDHLWHSKKEAAMKEVLVDKFSQNAVPLEY